MLWAMKFKMVLFILSTFTLFDCVVGAISQTTIQLVHHVKKRVELFFVKRELVVDHSLLTVDQPRTARDEVAQLFTPLLSLQHQYNLYE